MKIIASILVLLTISMTALAADVDGTWTGTASTPGGDFPIVFKLKADGAKLTGTTQGFDGSDVPIADGAITGNTITFNVTLDFGGMPFMLSYKGIVAAEEIKMTVDAAGMPIEFVLHKQK
jgi:hypothetical protein